MHSSSPSLSLSLILLLFLCLTFLCVVPSVSAQSSTDTNTSDPNPPTASPSVTPTPVHVVTVTVTATAAPTAVVTSLSPTSVSISPSSSPSSSPSPSTKPNASDPFAPSLPKCLNGGPNTTLTPVLHTMSNCNPETNGPLSDASIRFLFQEAPVCRLLCYDKPILGRLGWNNTKTEPTGCAICEQADMYMRYSLDSRNDYDPQFVGDAGSNVVTRTLCIPHSVCAQLCPKKISDNCVYTGSCTHAVCFEHEDEKNDDNIQVDLSRVTFYGPNSVVNLVKRSSTNASDDDDIITAIKPDTTKNYADAVRHAWDECPARKFSFPASFDPSLAASAGAPHAPRTASADVTASLPFLDGADTLSRETPQKVVQCRIFNIKFRHPAIEVVRNVTHCNLCNEITFSLGDHKTTITYPVSENVNGTIVTEKAERVCIPMSVCAEKCGSLPPGCVYTGSCRSVFCLSGLRSKRPVDFPFFSDDGAINGFLINDAVESTERESVMRNGRAYPLFVDGSAKVRGSATENTTWEESGGKMPTCSNQSLPSDAPQYGGGATGILPEPTPAPAERRR